MEIPMNATTSLFIAEIIISLTLTIATLMVLTRPLINVLKELCPTQKQAEFWLAYTRIMLAISPLLLVLIVDGFVSSSDLMVNIRVAIFAALAGLFLGMIIVGKRIFAPATQQCEAKS
jgi:membrane-associated HD superfamily phosphohydrolase